MNLWDLYNSSGSDLVVEDLTTGALGKALVGLLGALTEESQARTKLHKRDLAVNEKAVAEGREKHPIVVPIANKEQGLMAAPFGYCPECGAKGVNRSRSCNRDLCEQGHDYPSNDATLSPICLPSNPEVTETGKTFFELR